MNLRARSPSNRLKDGCYLIRAPQGGGGNSIVVFGRALCESVGRSLFVYCVARTIGASLSQLLAERVD